MGNNEGLHYVSLLPIIALERGDECRVIMSSFLHIILYYYMLLHIVAFANTMCDLVSPGAPSRMLRKDKPLRVIEPAIKTDC